MNRVLFRIRKEFSNACILNNLDKIRHFIEFKNVDVNLELWYESDDDNNKPCHTALSLTTRMPWKTG